MPLVTTKSHGGPFDDLSYTMGWLMGSLDATLPNTQCALDIFVHASNMPQVELLAMKHGFTVVITGDTRKRIPKKSPAVDEGPWLPVTLSRVRVTPAQERIV